MYNIEYRRHLMPVFLLKVLNMDKEKFKNALIAKKYNVIYQNMPIVLVDNHEDYQTIIKEVQRMSKELNYAESFGIKLVQKLPEVRYVETSLFDQNT